MRRARGLGVRRERFHAEALRELGAPLAARARDEHVRGRHEMLVEEAADHRLGHGAAADERKALSGEGHSRIIGERRSRSRDDA